MKRFCESFCPRKIANAIKKFKIILWLSFSDILAVNADILHNTIYNLRDSDNMVLQDKHSRIYNIYRTERRHTDKEAVCERFLI